MSGSPFGPGDYVGLLLDILDAGYSVLDSDTCRIRPGRVAQARVSECPCALSTDGCPIVAEIHGSGDSSGHIMLLDSDHRIAHLNRPAPGRSIDEVLGQRIYEAVVGAMFDREDLRGFLEAGLAGDVRVEATRANGDPGVWVVRGRPLPLGYWELRVAMVEAEDTSASGVHWATDGP